MDPISIVTASISIAATAVKTLKRVHDYHENYKEIRLSVSSLRSQLILTQQTLAQIDGLVKEKVESDNITRPVLSALTTGVEACNEILHDIDRFANEEAVKTVKGKVEYIWNRSVAQSKKQDLHIQIQSLSALVTVLQAQSLQDQRGQLGRLFGTIGRAKRAAANAKRQDSVVNGDGDEDPPNYSPYPDSREWRPQPKSQRSGPKPTRKWSSTILITGDTKRQLSRELIDAAADGDLKLVDELWGKGGDVNYQSKSEMAKKSRMTAVHAAIWEGHLHVLECLVDREAQLDRVMDGGLTALHIATCQDYPDIVKFLLDHGVDANAKDDLGETALFGAPEDITRLLLNAKANVSHRNNVLATPLHRAAYIGYQSVARDLVDSGADVNSKDKHGKTPLHHACDCSEDAMLVDRVAIVSNLLKAGANPNVPARVTNATPLHQAVQSGHPALVDLLLDVDANVNARTGSGYTSLHFAAELGSPTILDCLVKSAADIHAQTIENKHTPLHSAVIRGQVGCTEALIKAGANLEARCSKGMTALHYAAEGTSVEVITALIEARANTFARDLKHQTPLHLVRELSEAVKQLIGATASVDARDAREATPLHTVVQRGSLRTVEVLLDHHAPIDAVNGKKQTSLEVLCSNEELWVIEDDDHANPKNGSHDMDDTDADAQDGWESDSQAPWEVRLDIVKLLLERGAEVSKTCVKSVAAWKSDQSKAIVLAALCPKTSGMAKLMTLTNRAVIGSGLSALIQDCEAAIEKKVVERKEEKEKDLKKRRRLGRRRKRKSGKRRKRRKVRQSKGRIQGKRARRISGRRKARKNHAHNSGKCIQFQDKTCSMSR